MNNLVKVNTKIDSEIVKELYPEDEELYQKIKNMQNMYQLSSINEEDDERKENDNNNSKDYDVNKSRAKSASRRKKEEEIETKVGEFRRRLRESIAKDIETERINEARRIREYEEANNINDKKRIEQKNKGERKEFGLKMNELNENIEKYVDEYRTKLLKESGLY